MISSPQLLGFYPQFAIINNDRVLDSKVAFLNDNAYLLQYESDKVYYDNQSPNLMR